MKPSRIHCAADTRRKSPRHRVRRGVLVLVPAPSIPSTVRAGARRGIRRAAYPPSVASRTADRMAALRPRGRPALRHVTLCFAACDGLLRMRASPSPSAP
ncbi:hypothetical protein GCM10017576_28760 [Microbacterium barkeri]|uniref:Uncharacterized protein n=1 Tax=Microbacterium barkeri TaxID=33917 RepID=A0A9W6H550_9MICO|nr:hypothetical protein GCM10017576_28760 [Microbacterium barkeri]